MTVQFVNPYDPPTAVVETPVEEVIEESPAEEAEVKEKTAPRARKKTPAKG